MVLHTVAGIMADTTLLTRTSTSTTMQLKIDSFLLFDAYIFHGNSEMFCEWFVIYKFWLRQGGTDFVCTSDCTFDTLWVI